MTADEADLENAFPFGGMREKQNFVKHDHTKSSPCER